MYYLNTSHVNVNPNLASANLASADNLNTSHVNVNRDNTLAFDYSIMRFKYISC